MRIIGDITSAHFWELVLLYESNSQQLMRNMLYGCPLMVLLLCWIDSDASESTSVMHPCWVCLAKRCRNWEENHKTVATVIQMSLLLMNYTRAHFSSNEILNGVIRTLSPLCIAELYKVMDLNGNSLLVLMKHKKHSQFTQREGEWEGGVKW